MSNCRSNLNQPKTAYDDEGDSLGSEDLFETNNTDAKPVGLLAAAKKARADIDMNAEKATKKSRQTAK